MPRSPKDNEEIRRARRDAIVQAATRVFARNGLAQSKISDIAAEAGLSHGLVYHYFDSKEAVFSAIVDAMIARIDEDLAMPHERALERIVASFERHRARHCEPIDEQRILAQAMMQGAVPPEIQARLTSHFAHVYRTLRDWIAEAQQQGDIDAAVPAAELAATWICVVRGMSLRLPGMPDLPFPLPETATIVRLLLPRAASSDAPTRLDGRASSAPPPKRPSAPKTRGTSRAKTGS
jgi:AcrR family transcriptional regulator